jgi:hypothetical protein
MDFSSITSIISQVGFPIACCIYLIYSNNKQNDKNAEELEKLRQALENNTKAMIELKSMLGGRHE